MDIIKVCHSSFLHLILSKIPKDRLSNKFFSSYNPL
jgi:hypothetical protein